MLTLEPGDNRMQEDTSHATRREEHSVEEALRRLQKAVETMQLGVTITDINGKIVYTNSADARMHGYTVEELIGRDVSVFCLPGYRRSLTADRLHDMKSWRRESMNVRKDGTLLPVALMSDVVSNARGEPVGVVTTCENLTEAKRAEAERQRLEVQVRRSQKLESLAVLAGGLAHDFTNLLTGILGNASLLLDELPPEASTQLDKVVDMQKAALRLSELTNQLLAYSGNGQCETEPVSVNDIVKDLMHVLEVSKPQNVRLRYDLADDLPTIAADPAQLRQVIQHLATNASEAIGPDDGEVTIRTGIRWVDRDYLTTTYLGNDALQGKYVFIEVSDTGCGMDDETRTKLFDPFFTTKFTGRGLGLAAVMGIVRAHEGAIRVDSIRDRRTSIIVLLPAVEVETEPVTADEGPAAWRGEGTILVADADPVVRSVTKNFLEHQGFRVVTATDGRDAVATFREHADEIVAILLDLAMPPMMGDEALDLIHKDRPDIPVIVMSGYAEAHVRERFSEKQVIGFLQIPFRSRALMDKLRQAVKT